MLLQQLLISIISCSQLSQTHLEKLLSHQARARQKRATLSAPEEVQTLEFDTPSPEILGVRISFPNGRAPIPILVDTHGNPLELPPFMVWASENAALQLSNGEQGMVFSTKLYE